MAKRQLAEVEHALDAYRARRHEFEQISAAELRSRLQTGEVVLLDVLSQAEWAVPGSLCKFSIT